MLSTGLLDYESAKPLTVTVATARKLSGLGNTTIWALIKDQTLETVHVGRRTLITYRSLEALLAPRSQPRPHRRRGRPCKTAERHRDGRRHRAVWHPASLVPEVKRTAWRGIRSPGGLAHA